MEIINPAYVLVSYSVRIIAVGQQWTLVTSPFETFNTHYYTLSDACSEVNWADLMAAQGVFGTDFMTGLPER